MMGRRAFTDSKCAGARPRMIGRKELWSNHKEHKERKKSTGREIPIGKQCPKYRGRSCLLWVRLQPDMPESQAVTEGNHRWESLTHKESRKPRGEMRKERCER